MDERARAKEKERAPCYELDEVYESELAAAVLDQMEPEERRKLLQRDILPTLPRRDLTWTPGPGRELDPVTEARMKPLHANMDGLLRDRNTTKESDARNKKELRTNLNALSKWVSSLVMETYKLREELSQAKLRPAR
jgi:hypothetical protein